MQKSQEPEPHRPPQEQDRQPGGSQGGHDEGCRRDERRGEATVDRDRSGVHRRAAGPGPPGVERTDEGRPGGGEDGVGPPRIDRQPAAFAVAIP